MQILNRRTAVRITLILVVASLIAASMPAPLSAFTRQETERSRQDGANKPQDNSAQEPAPKPKKSLGRTSRESRLIRCRLQLSPG